MARLVRKLDNARSALPAAVWEGQGAPVGIIAYGSSHHAVVESRDQLRREKGIEADYLRVRAYPFSRDVEAFLKSHERTYVVEQNRDGQLAALVRLDIAAELVPRLRSVAHIPGLPLDARSITEEISAREGH